jgi:hypothetical protein
MNYIMLLAAAIGIGPALLLMFITFADYTYPKVERPFFDDRKMFSIFTVGLIIGVILASVIGLFDRTSIITIVSISLLVLLVMLVILMLKRFALRLDTAFYGTALGLGIGAMMAFYNGYQVLAAYDVLGESIPLETYFIVLLWAIQLVCINATCGAIIGIGSARGHPWSALGQATLLLVTYYLLLIPLFELEPGTWTYITFGLASIFTAYGYYYVHKKALPGVVREAIGKMKRGTKGTRAN